MKLRSESILEDIAALNTADDSRARRYITALDAGMQAVLDEAGGELPSSVWLKRGDPREITCGAGYLAFFHSFPKSKFYRDPRLLAGFRSIMSDVLMHQLDTGELSASGSGGVERPGRFPPHTGSSHGQSWYLEPLLLGMNWLRNEFTPAERARIDRALYRTADFICARPIHEMHNRSVVVCAILALCGRYFREERFLREAIRTFHGEPIRVFDEISGQIFEGSGPDGNYSATTYAYLYMYRIMSGDVDIDRRMIAALKWRSRVQDPNGLQTFCGATTRVPITGSAQQVHDHLPAFERYSPQEPFFQKLIEQYLPLVERGGLGRPGHCISPTIWALLEHSPSQPPASVPAWYSDMRTWQRTQETGTEHYYYNEGYDSLYFPIRQRYTTCVAVRGRAPYKDLQCWTYESEPPTIYPAGGDSPRASRTRAWGIDTAAQNASGVKIASFCWVPGDPPGLIVQWSELWRYYVFTPRTTFILTDGEMGRCETEWVVDTRVCGTPHETPGALLYPGRQGRLRFEGPCPRPTISGQIRTYKFPFERAPFWFALTDETFSLESFDAVQARFRDGSGTYIVTHRFVPGPAVVEKKAGTFTVLRPEHLQISRA